MVTIELHPGQTTTRPIADLSFQSDRFGGGERVEYFDVYFFDFRCEVPRSRNCARILFRNSSASSLNVEPVMLPVISANSAESTT